MLGVCDKSIRRLILRGLLRPSRALRHILIPKDELERNAGLGITLVRPSVD
jgi:hypothetical protein